MSGRGYHSEVLQMYLQSENLIAYFRNVVHESIEKRHNFRRFVPLSPMVTPLLLTLSTRLDKVCLVVPWDARSAARARPPEVFRFDRSSSNADIDLVFLKLG